MNQPRRQAYLTLIESLFNCPSEEETAILQANLELLDDDFAEYLREWAAETLPNLDADIAENLANVFYNLDIKISSLKQGSRKSNLEIAIACLDIGLTIFTREAYSEKWAMFQNSLGIKYWERIKGDRGDNLERAIAFYEAALEVRTREAFPQDWAMTQNNWANAYKNRIKGDRGENLERAITAYKLALSIYTREAFPQDWAMTQNNLANAYRDRIRGDWGENLETAIKFYEAALKVRTREAFPKNWAATQNNLANAYQNRIREDRGENLERAITAYELALSIYTREAFPQDWAMTQHNLANAYKNRIREDRGENLERAITAYELALEVRTREAFPQDWAMTQNNLALAYSNRIMGDRGENVERAIVAYELALLVRTPEAFPEKWAMTQNNLAIAYCQRITGDSGENLEKAIALYKLAVSVRTREAFPEDWATTQNNLANAYKNRLRGDRGENLDIAIGFYQAALEVCTPATLPLYCLGTGRNLGNLGFAENLLETALFGYEKAIQAVEQSREWLTSDNRKREIIEENLDVYENMVQSCINHQQYHKAVQTVERSKSRYLVELFTNSEIYPKTATEFEKQQLQDLRRQIAALRQFLEAESSSSSLDNGGESGIPGLERTTQTRNLSSESFQQQKDTLVTKLQQLEQLLQPFKQREPEFVLTQKVEPIDIAEFQQTLDAETAIVEWYIGNSKFASNDQDWGGVAFVITHDAIEFVTLAAAEISELEAWQKHYLEEYRSEDNTIWKQTLSEKLQKLSEILRLDEIVAKIPEHCSKLILVPHRYLHLFPLHALPFTSETRFNPTTEFCGYLLDCFPGGVKYAPSLQLLQLVQNRSKTRTSPAPELQPLFAIQNPTEDLSNADMEVETIKQRFDTHNILIRKGATKIAFNENIKNLSNAGYIHFSCHGFFNFDYPLLSLLVLADSLESPTSPPTPHLQGEGSQEKDKENPYVTMHGRRKVIPEKCLTLREIFAELELSHYSLVTLSACETGLTNSTEMTDEYIGLPSGFLYAGSMNVVSTLWSVDAFATAILMIKFYQELLHKVSVAVALNAAQNWMRAVSREDLGVWVKSLNLDKKSGQSVELWLTLSPEAQPFSHPKYWAAFCATGY
ncbi:CHAT domain-containing protein [Microcoleus sp. OTE_8_concoct_300]|uniref:CHAT domain-containing protein n=1 Tax=Microcoleus sp. OTE_8_concoct_300 TaxID=2964710 RepID=UPI00403F2BF8